MTHFLLIDNYDSFTYNLLHLVGSVSEEKIDVVRNDVISVEEISARAPRAIIISPGPKTPSQAGICLPAIRHFRDKIPIFGVCLGLQCVAEAFGARIVRASQPMHGKKSKISHNGTGIFKGLNKEGFTATRYHSLTVAPESLPDTFEVTATSGDEMIMAIAHKTLPVHAVQFHPESIGSEHGAGIVANFVNIVRNFNEARREERA